jgi:uncharacterized membrane-anchored protein
MPYVIGEVDVAGEITSVRADLLPVERGCSKLPQVTLAFWVMKIAATTLGETAGDLLAQTMKVGYLVSSAILVVLFAVSLVTQLRSTRFHPALYWTVILSTSTAGTTMSDFLNRSAKFGYFRGMLLLLGCLGMVFLIWRASGQTFDVAGVTTFRAEVLYWAAILFSNTLGTSLGDFLADDTHLGFGGSALLISGLIGLIVVARYTTRTSATFLFWSAFVLTRPLGATTGDFFSKPVSHGGLGYGTIGASAILATALIVLIAYQTRQTRRPATRVY